jgi:hypothetical protein
MARRFRRCYQREASGPAAAVEEDAMDWHRGVHALRILVELGRWDALGTRPGRGHPWILLEPVARRVLGLAPA